MRILKYLFLLILFCPIGAYSFPVEGAKIIKQENPPLCKPETIIIDKLPFSIIESNKTYCLSKSFENFSEKTAIAIFPNVENIIIDLNGNKISTTPDPENISYGIEGYGIKNVAVKNGQLEGFFMCIRLGTRGAGYVVENIVAKGCTFRGIFLNGENAIVKNNHIENTGGYLAYDPSYSFGIELVAGNNAIISDNDIINTFSPEKGAEAVGISISNNNNNIVIEDNNIINSKFPENPDDRSIGIWVGDGSVVNIKNNKIKGMVWGVGMSRLVNGIVKRNNITNTKKPLVISGKVVDQDGQSLTNWE